MQRGAARVAPHYTPPFGPWNRAFPEIAERGHRRATGPMARLAALVPDRARARPDWLPSSAETAMLPGRCQQIPSLQDPRSRPRFP